MRCFTPALTAILLASISAPLCAQNQSKDAVNSAEYIDELKSCQQIASDAERLTCFDVAVSSMVTASEAGEVQIVDKQDVEATRRSLFGFSLPDIGIFGGGDEDDSDAAQEKRDLLETTITSVHYSKPNEIFFVTQEGATWRISDAPRRLRTVKAGQPVVFKRAAMGSFFIRINGQTGVKGRRIR